MLATEMKKLTANTHACVDREWDTILKRIRDCAMVGNSRYEYVLKTENPEVIGILCRKLKSEGFECHYAEAPSLDGTLRTLKIKWVDYV